MPAAPEHPAPPLVVMMGVSGSGKTTVGAALAQRLRVPFADADDFHPEANIAKMSAGIPLDDEDRGPWLDAIAAWLAEHSATGGVASCSALKRAYRDVLAARVAGRPGHFMPAALIDSQFATLEVLEPDELGATLDVALSVDTLVDRSLAILTSPSSSSAAPRHPLGSPSKGSDQS